MCGINGFNWEDRGVIENMNVRTRHRGPDDTGVAVGSGWSLGNNRLAIIDLSPQGHQPMESADGRYVIVYNGEIYNFKEVKKDLAGYTWRSESDTEVLLAAYSKWGPECLARFNGMFAFAILDRQNGELFIARDRMGIKPLYYYQNGSKFIFSSEAKAIFEHGISQEVDQDSLNIYFRLLYVPAPRTIWKDVYKLEPGHYLKIKNGKCKNVKYWSFPNNELITDKSYLEGEIKNLLEDSVKMQLISDRPVGVFLSGGIDSTIIAGIASKLSPHIKTFSVGFTETEESDKYNNDFHIARRTASHFKTDHREYLLSAEDVIRALPEAIYHMDEPISNHVQAVNMLLARRVAAEATVVLGGDGGDELFGGYERYYYSHKIDQVQRFIPQSLFKMFAPSLASHPGVERYMQFFAQKEDIVSQLLSPDFNRPGLADKIFGEQYLQNIKAEDFTRQFMRTDILSWLPSESLVRSDKMSMAASIEGRVPFLDHRLVELADRIPIEYKLGSKGLALFSKGRGYQGKIILREAMGEYLPDFVLSQPKWGWFSPAAKWLRGPLLPLAREVFSRDYNVATREMFDYKALNKLLDDHIAKRKYALVPIWAVLTFQLWYRQFAGK